MVRYHPWYQVLRDLNLHCAYEDLRFHVKETALKKKEQVYAGV